MGPTASGKTALAVELAQRLPCEIISVDSAMVYRGMDIGTAKPNAEIRALAPHRLLDIRDPADSYSAGQFRDDALREITDIMAHDRIPLLVGGTMLYFHILQQGLASLPTADPALRQQLLAEAEQHGWQALHERLQKIDPVAAARIHPNDPQRLQRALEVYALTGKTLTELCSQADTHSFPYQVINIALAPSARDQLHHDIALRLAQMLQQGFIEEVAQLMQRSDLTPDLPALRAVGYRQVWDYLLDKFNYEQMHERALIATRQLAKRQLTWLRSWENLSWFDSQDSEHLAKVLALLKQTSILS